MDIINEDKRSHTFRDSVEDAKAADRVPDTPQSRSPAYRLAFVDEDFMMREELRPVRLQLELLKPQMILDERGIESTVVMFGGARIPAPERKETAKTPMLGELTKYYEEARRFAHEVTNRSLQHYGRQFVVCTGGGPGVMEAGNRGANEAGGQSIGLNILLPHEQAPNAFVTPDLSFNFHYFALRKMHFLMRARAVTVFPGGFGTLDEMFEALTLIQTRRMKRIPIILFGIDFWKQVVNWDLLVEAGTINAEDLHLLSFVETAGEALAIIDAWDYGCE
ncbi:LOG family protein [Sinirhodobacter populi]|uniref:AMP nucleosidase n=1 Tax=Paenirhodobacter populi TaxID=2306993 RepID=A0A443K137_9RHOB|nr:LOG family protein [Sinirhodobacter populi]RWR26461.1 LOG family protein [Sinirhodobacter populi]